MPIYDIGYRGWDGPLRTGIRRFWPISRVGYELSKQGKLMSRLLFAAWTPLLYFVPMFFVVGYFTQPGNQTPGFASFLAGALSPEVAEILAAEPEISRPIAWQVLFYWFFAYVGVFFTFLMLSSVGPKLIADDMKSKAYLVYFSKPISIRDYILGKLGVIFLFMGRLLLLPALVLYAMSIMFSPGFETILHTGYLFLAIVLSFVVLTVPVALVVLFLSSLMEARFATFLWMGIFIAGQVASRSLSSIPGVDEQWSILLSIEYQQRLVLQKIYAITSGPDSAAELFSRWLDVDPPWEFALACLVTISVVCAYGLYRRIKAPLSI